MLTNLSPLENSYAGVAGLTLGGIYATMMGNPDKAAGAAKKIDQKLDFVAEGKSAPHTPHVGDRK